MKTRKGSKGKRRQPQDRRDVPPTWRSAVNRALIGAVIFGVLLIVPFHQPPGSSIALAVLMMALYVPMGYYIERFFYNRRQAQKQRVAQKNGKG
jgi:Sec-independent protein secretion pathway component TatC